jgi:hypothetical protein
MTLTLDFQGPKALEFKDTGTKSPPGHVTDTMCKPDITAAFEGDWKEEKRDVVHWPFIRLAGEKASKGKNREVQKSQAISYLHYLLLARPDLYVAQGLLSSNKSVIFYFGIGGKGIKQFEVNWKDPEFKNFLYAFIYRLYNPRNFVDSSYIETKFDEETVAKYTISIAYQGRTIDCDGFYSIYAKNPFATRTHVLSNPGFTYEGDKITIIKDQLCRVKRRFEELTILNEYVHKPEAVPGVVVAASGKRFNYPWSEERCKHRLGLIESGSPFASIPTLSKVLETLFDVLEGIRISVAMRRADMFASIAVFAGPPPCPSSRYQLRKRALYREFVESPATAELHVCSFCATGGSHRVAALLCQASPEREVRIDRS